MDERFSSCTGQQQTPLQLLRLMTLPKHIQKAVDLGLLQLNDEGKINGVAKQEVETVFGMARLLEKIEPTTKFEGDDTKDQESIILCRVLTSPSGLAKELWSELRTAVGVGYGQSLPRELWSTDTLRSIGGLIDLIFNGEADGATLISRESLIAAFPKNNVQYCAGIEFNQTVTILADPSTMASYGDSNSEWGVALDLLRQERAKANFRAAQDIASKSIRSDSKLEKAIEAQQQQLMTCLGMLRGSVGQMDDAKDFVDALCGGENNLINRVMKARAQSEPVSTGIPAMDIDMEGGVRRPGESQGGRLFTLAARTGVGKTVLGVWAAANLAFGGLTVGFISAELQMDAIVARLAAAATKLADPDQQTYGWASVGAIDSPDHHREKTSNRIMNAAGVLQENGGKLLVKDPWGASVDDVINILRSLKAKNPELRAAVIDHFHVLARHKGAPSSEAAMLEERAYRLMTVAKELEIDLIVLAQMNRVGMDAVGKKEAPTLDQIRGTDALSHVSHAVWIVRREIISDDVSAEEKAKRPLEMWHSKTRGRQAYWDGNSMQGLSFVECSKLHMDYAYSAVALDETPIPGRR